MTLWLSPSREVVSATSDTVVERPTKRRKPHRKSRHGCLNCKRRKVKCDENGPTCSRCIAFGITCVYKSINPPLASPDQPSSYKHVSKDGTLAPRALATVKPLRRGRGRPRNNYSASLEPNLALSSSVSGKEVDTSLADTPPRSELNIGNNHGFHLDIDDIELLLHFTSRLARDFAPSGDLNDAMSRFWTHNVSQLGLSHPFILYLVLALAGYHLHFQEKAKDTLPEALATSSQLVSDGSTPNQDRYQSLASRHFHMGLTGLNKTLRSIDETNCGALYIGATLVCYCAFAAGPTAANDLLICHTRGCRPGEIDVRWLPLTRGVRLIRESFATDVLFSGLLAAFGGKTAESEEDLDVVDDASQNTEGNEKPRGVDVLPTYLQEGFARMQWENQFNSLRQLISTTPSALRKDATPSERLEVQRTSLKAMENLHLRYSATYGRDLDGNYDGPPDGQFILGWLYHLDEDFVAHVRSREPIALLVLAYFTPLLHTLAKCWFLRGWPEHLLVQIRRMLQEDGSAAGELDLAAWITWPMAQIGLTG
ncbi:hypothetical protein TruAng_008883 [Truncatella angustata]|nr:hypothetical protein TruAng_008883 [Truncatella angustata]